LNIRTTALLTIIATTAIIAVVSLMTGFFTSHDRSTEQALLISGIVILATGGVVAFFASNIIAQPFKTLHELKQSAEDASAAKSSFLTNTSHEMRTPLNAIIGLSELALHRKDLHPEVADNLEKIYSSGMMLLSIVNDLLDISKIESRKFELISNEYDTPSMINDTRSLNMLRIADKPIDFLILIDETLPSRLIGDELRIKQIFDNLLENACNYTEKGSIEWSIGWEQDADTVWLISSVKDTGIGIREEDIGRLFTGYHQNFQNSRKAQQGSGLGLVIANRMAEAMNGSITVSSVYGEGSTFTVRIQQKYVPSPPIGRAVVEALNGHQGRSYTTNKRLRTMKFARVAMPYARVLIVDDVQTNLDVAKGILKPYGMQVDCVISGIDAIERIRNSDTIYDAIFMDHMMPEMDGIEATRIIREEIDSDYARNIPIIALTANAIVGNEEIFLGKGFQAFLSKPVDVMRMDQVLRQWVRNKEREHDSFADSMSCDSPDRIDDEENPQIEGIDWQAGLNYFAGNRDVYLSILRSYVDNTSHLITQICNVTEETLSDYAIHVHGIKGSSYGIKAREIGEQAEKLEHAAKAGNFQLVSKNTPLFVENVQKLLSALSGLLKIDANGEKPRRHAPDETLLDAMEKAASNFKIDELEEIMAALECFTYETQAELLVWLREKVNQMGFAAIHERLVQREWETPQDRK
jgi:signal transduction histidine kinase/DNA-binding NarL/FixJ family response regulator/HPt (histidine-containing phosphotransfer) domain-containing protein